MKHVRASRRASTVMHEPGCGTRYMQLAVLLHLDLQAGTTPRSYGIANFRGISPLPLESPGSTEYLRGSVRHSGGTVRGYPELKAADTLAYYRPLCCYGSD